MRYLIIRIRMGVQAVPLKNVNSLKLLSDSMAPYCTFPFSETFADWSGLFLLSAVGVSCYRGYYRRNAARGPAVRTRGPYYYY